MDHSAGAPRGQLGVQGDPQSIMHRLVKEALDLVPADRCTLTSIDSGVMRVETSYERNGHVPGFVGAEYPLHMVEQQPLLREAVRTAGVTTGPGFATSGEVVDQARPDIDRMRQVAVVPLTRGGRTEALLILSRAQDKPFDRHELVPLHQIATMSALALHNARLLEQVGTAQGRALEALTRISRLVAVSDDRISFFEKMTETVADLVGAGRAAFWLLDGKRIAAQPSSGFSEQQIAAMQLEVSPENHLRLGRVLQGEAVRFDSAEFADADPVRAIVDAMGVRDGLSVPWRTADQVIGVLMAYDARSGWGDQEEWMLRFSARVSALVWQGFEAEHRAAALNAMEVSRLAEHAARSASLDEQKSEFLRLASHELRTPMTLVRGYLSMLEEGALGRLPEQAEQVIPIMTSRMTQMAQLVEQMLAASRAEEAGSQPVIAEVDLSELTRHVVHSLEGLVQPLQRLNLDGEAGVKASVDSEKTELVLTNLISNAIKYSPEGGDITVRVMRDGRRARIEVEDHGIGIAENDRPLLFRPFGRVQSETVDRIQGTGLGLYLARRIARLQGGDIEVSSEPGSGSTFSLVVPAPPG